MLPPTMRPLVAQGAPRDIELWWLDLREPVAGDSFGDLDEQEIDRMRRFRFERDSTRFGRSHLALRLVLSDRLGISPTEVQYEFSSTGKPRLKAADWNGSFNMSHSGDLALFGFSRSRPIGVDIELAAPADAQDLLTTAHACFTAQEVSALVKTSTTQRHKMFLRCWSRKEACLKALGTGLSIEPSSFEAGCSESRQAVAIQTDSRLSRLDVVSIQLPETLRAEAAVAWGHANSAQPWSRHAP